MDIRESLQRAEAHIEAGRPARCIDACNAILADHPGLIQALYLRGCASLQTGDIAQSIDDLDVVYGNEPGHAHAAWYFGRSLCAAGRLQEALAPLESALSESELEVRARYEIARCLTRLRRRTEAMDHYRAILALQPGNAQVAANLASLLGRENRLDEAREMNTRALELDAANETAQLTRATLDRRAGRHADGAERLRDLLPRVANPINRSIVWNQLGKCLEELEAWDEAFGAFAESNRILLAHHPAAVPDQFGPHGLQTLARIEDWLQGKPMAGWQEPAEADAGGIVFLVGFPRSGTTLLDRMLSAHPDIEVLEEKSLFSRLHQDWARPGVLEALADVSDEQILDARRIYRREMAGHRRQADRPVVVDKLPLNLAYLFLIRRLFPEAPVIFLQRHPFDACLSCFCQAFELEASMGYFLDLELTAQYYDAVMRVAAQSVDQLNNPVLALRYEDLVTTPGGVLAGLTEFLGLPCSESMLDYRRPSADDASDTPSYEQVRQPLNTRSIGRWRHYAHHVVACRRYLQTWVEHFGYPE